MTYRITVRPSGHVFEAEAQESILQAGLRAGLNLTYSCATGSCGGCRTRLLAGSIEALSHGDFAFSEVERLAGWFLPCRYRAASDLIIEAHETGSAAEIPEQHLVAKVVKLERVQEGVILLQLRTPRSRGLRFLAGQSVNLCFEGMRPRALPIASCPCDPMHLRFHVRFRPGDPFSEFVFERLRKGREVVLSGPLGDFTLDEGSSRPLLFVAWESGFAPIESLVDHAIQLDPDRCMHLYWLSAMPQGHYLANYCRAWVDALDDFHFHAINLKSIDGRALARPLEDIARAHMPLHDWDLYLALPAAATAQASTLFDAAEHPPAQRRTYVVEHP